jgi:hypothetical protein
MLAYVFWHQARRGVGSAEYEDGLRAFHARLSGRSGCFRLSELPFGDGGAGYEDWYLVEDWAALGALNSEAVTGERHLPHDGVAQLASNGWGGVYRLIRGPARLPRRARWISKPSGASYEAFVDAQPEATVWMRQMVLGPAPEFCCVVESDEAEDPVRDVVHLDSVEAPHPSGDRDERV